MNKVFKGVIIGFVGVAIGVSLTIKGYTTYATNNNNTKDFYITNDTTDNNGKRLIEFSDNSWCVINENEDTYIFQPYQLGDWDYKLNDIKQLENIIKTYYDFNLNDNA